MKESRHIPDRIFTAGNLLKQLSIIRFLGKKTVFTNGVFDMLHRGHLSLLSQAASFGDFLIVGINSDSSVKRLKGPDRPVNDEQTRALIMASLLPIDAVVIFEEDTPLNLIKMINPDVLVKGGDYSIETIVGAQEVQQAGGTVKIISLEEGLSTTATIARIRNL